MSKTYYSTQIITYLTIVICLFNFSLAFGQELRWYTSEQSAVSNQQSAAKTDNRQPTTDNRQPAGKNTNNSPIEKTGYRIKTIVIDAGHGGHDPGCLGGNTQEKHIALALAQKLADNVRQQFPSVKVILTRNDDTFIPLHERAAIANHNDADLFMSIHCNYMPGRAGTAGTETYVMGLHTASHNLEVAKRENAVILLEDNYKKNYDYDPNSAEGHIIFSMFQNAYLEQSILFADKIESKLKSDAGRNSRGVKQAGFVVLKETTMPSVLVEAGFLSNVQEEAFLNSEEGQQYVADALLLAFAEYKQSVEGGQAAADSYEVVAKPVQASQTQRKSPEKAKEQPLVNVSPQKSSPTQQNKMQQQGQQDRRIIPINYEDTPVPVTDYANQDWTAKSGNPLNTTNNSSYPTGQASGISFFVQLAAAPQPMDTGQPRWRNTGFLIEVVQEDNMYKYQVREFNTYQQAFEGKLILQSAGFPDAFIVAYKNGRRISLEQARQEAGL
ncbi:MAG: N-acetylmuramoyl-L-alanine amidase [Saprospiraceae bacterium]|nr:N-acetylmuramoyl-L-alanine amidase [Saprospiraceae bacterium]